jgi:hypothetical protein
MTQGRPYVTIDFNFMHNGYVRQYAKAEAYLPTEDKLECEAACVNAIMNKKFKTSPKWDY